MHIDADFDSRGTRCAAWLFLPEEPGPRPCVVMAHGFSAVREQRLDAYAEHFRAAGFAVLLFDYRYFGSSDGEPRQLLSIRHQLDDWRAAVKAARALPGVDPARIALFGSSFSGGHVQAIAAEDSGIAAVISQVPFCDGLKNLPALGLGPLLRLSAAGLRDGLGALFGMKPYRIAAVGEPGSLAVMTTPDAVEGFMHMNPPGSTWRNEVCARIALHVGTYRPGLSASRIRCPILYCIAEQDQLTPASFAHEAAQRAPRGESRSYDCGHFDLYVEPFFPTVIADQIGFLRQNLEP